MIKKWQLFNEAKKESESARKARLNLPATAAGTEVRSKKDRLNKLIDLKEKLDKKKAVNKLPNAEPYKASEVLSTDQINILNNKLEILKEKIVKSDGIENQKKPIIDLHDWVEETDSIRSDGVDSTDMAIWYDDNRKLNFDKLL